MIKKTIVKVIGAGLAGVEAAWYLANKNFKVKLYEMKPNNFTPAHKDDKFAELVCSNSLRSNDLFNAAGLLKQEMRILRSLTIESADKNKVPAGSALAVDRYKFSSYITEKISNHPNIEILNQKVEQVSLNDPTIIATGPLTDESLMKNIENLIGDDSFYFFDAVSPIIKSESINYEKAFFADRYDKGEGDGDYLNCPMNDEEYDKFYQELISAKSVKLKDFEYSKIFEGCMPIEVMAKRGKKAMLFGPLKPVGISNKNKSNEKYRAVVQLRRENAKRTLFNIVGFQTNLTYSEQKRVFRLIPSLENAEFARFGVMHRNTYINAPKIINKYYQLKNNPNIFLAGQLSGVEGYIESASSGLYAAINMANHMLNKEFLEFSSKTAIGALPNYIISSSEKNFQPMNINWGIIDDLDVIIKDKRKKRVELADIAIDDLKKTIDKGEEDGTI